MPPKAARGRAPRGRGRGKAPALTPSSDPTLAAADESPALASTKTTPQNEINDGTTIPSPNPSPATVPTAIPVSAPVRVPSIRAATTGSSSTRGGRGGGVAGRGRGKPVAESKFKPKAIRRDQGERDRLAEEESARVETLRKRAEEEADRLERAASRGRGFRGGRGRGDVMGRGVGRGSNASGLFGVTPEAMARSGVVPVMGRPGGGGGGGGGGGSGGGGWGSGVGMARFKREGGGGPGNYMRGQENGEDFVPVHYPDEDGTALVDIAQMNIAMSDDSDDEPIITGSRLVNKGKGREDSKDKKKKGLKPIRLDRFEHEERKTIVNTASENNDNIKIEPKAEDADDSDLMEIDELRSTQVEAPQEPEVKSELLEDLSMPASPEIQAKLDASSSASAPKSSANGKKTRYTIGKKKEKKPVLQTKEDEAEYQRHLDDVEILANELGGMQTAKNGEDDVIIEEGLPAPAPKQEVRDKTGRLYLFQFPPVLPKLYNPITKQKPEVFKQPTEDVVEEDEEFQMTGSSTKTDHSGKGSQTKTDEAVEVKLEEEVAPASRDVVEDEGSVGRVVVRKSGRVEVIWGGTNMVISRGVDAGYMAIGAVVDSLDRSVRHQSGEVPEGKASAMGQIMGKFLVGPDWEKLG